MNFQLIHTENDLIKHWRDAVYYTPTTNYQVFKFFLNQDFSLSFRPNAGYVISGILASHLKEKRSGKFVLDFNFVKKIIESSLSYISVVTEGFTDQEKINLSYARYALEHFLSTDFDTDDHARLLELGGWSRRFLEAATTSERIATKVISQDNENSAAWVLLAASLLDQGQLSDYLEAWERASELGGNPEYLQNLKNKYLVLTLQAQTSEVTFIESESPARKGLTKNIFNSEVKAISTRAELISKFIFETKAIMSGKHLESGVQAQLAIRIRDWEMNPGEKQVISVPSHLLDIFNQYQRDFGQLGMIICQEDFESYRPEFEKFHKADISISTYYPIFDGELP